MKQNMIEIRVRLWDKEQAEDAPAVTVIETLELPVAAPGDDGRQQIATALRAFERRVIERLENLKVLSVPNVEGADVYRDAMKNVAAEMRIPQAAITGIVPDDQSVRACKNCNGQGYLNVHPPLWTDQHGNVGWTKEKCDACGGFGKVGV